MQHFMQFVFDHWLLWTAFALVLILIIVEEQKGTTSVTGASTINTEKTVDYMNHHNALVVDLRDKNSYKNGHIVNAINVTYDKIENSQISKLNHYKNRPVILVGDDKNRTSKAATQLKDHGFNKVYILNGGIDQWRNDGYPLITRDKKQSKGDK
jgi:rhodanese-related sulfurtransferase